MMPARTFDRLDPAIAGGPVDIDAETKFRRLPHEVVVFARGAEPASIAALHDAIGAALPRRRNSGRVPLNPRPHVRAEVASFELVMALGAGLVAPSDSDIAAVSVGFGRKHDYYRWLDKGAATFGEKFGSTIGIIKAGVDPVEHTALQVIVACRQRLASGMALRRALVGLLAICHVRNRPPPAALLVAFACVAGVMDATTAMPVQGRLTAIVGLDADLVLAIAARDVEAGGRASSLDLGRWAPSLTRPKLHRVRQCRGYAPACSNLLAEIYADT